MNRRLPLGALVGLALLVAAGAAGIIWAMSGSDSVGDTARLAPADSLVYATVNTDPASRQWVQMAQLLKRLGLDDRMRDARASGLMIAGVDWSADIAPFLGGEATVAVTDLRGDAPGVLAILSVRDGARAWQHTTTKLDQLTGARPTSERYRGVEIRSYPMMGGPSLAVAQKDRYLIVASGAAAVRQALNLEAGVGESLAGSAKFTAARASVAADALLFTYINPGAAVGALDGALAGLTGGLTAGANSTQALRDAGMENAAVAFAASAERTGVRFEWQTVGVDRSRLPFAMPEMAQQSRFARRAPADSLVYVAGADLYAGVLRGVLQQAGQVGAGSSADALREAVQQATGGRSPNLGFDVEKDLLAYLRGEYGFALGAQGANTDSAWGLLFSGVSDAQAVGRTLATFGQYEQREGRRLTSSRVGAATVTESRPARSDGAAYAYTLVGDELIVSNEATAVRRALEGQSALADDPEFQAAMAQLPSGRTVTGFVNLRRIVQLMQSDAASLVGDTVDWDAISKLRYLTGALTQGADRVGGIALLRIAGE